MDTLPLLSLIIFLPLVGAAMILTIRGEAEIVARNARAVALWTSLATFILSLGLWAWFDPASPDFQFVQTIKWIPGLGINYSVGVDGISMLFVRSF